ncbi:unnamed protein product [Prorocentrum cordatum]|uniref:6-phosphofructo-2-kinase domain-containing protein n=1 Tax=Prorocentrum cordatum TaxID=2364126 RepID=A0ABN9V112_9DINO|nr:unnamed protein product [Polarella glacialis]
MPGLTQQQWQQKIVAPLFGLPMRGKAHTARNLKRFIQFFHGARAEIFDLTDYPGPDGDTRLCEDLCKFFHASEEDSQYDIYDFAASGRIYGGFAIILAGDSVESTRSMWSAHTKWHRRWMSRTCQEKLGAETCFIQISVDDEFGEQYIADLCRFRGVPLEQSKALMTEYRDRMENIQEDSEGDTPYIHLINYNQMMVVNKMMQGFVGSEVCHFLANLHPYAHTHYLSRHGESIFNVEKRLGGDSGLSKRGEEYARRLAEFVKYVQCGRADSIVCVTLTQEELRRLNERVSETPQGLVASGSWDGFGDASGAVVEPGMRLLRMQAGYGADFQDAPHTVQEVARVAGSLYPTLVFVQGDASEPGMVPGRLWTSSLKRTIETARFIERNVVAGKDGKPWRQMVGKPLRSIDEVYAGEFDGLTEEDIKKIAPEVIAARSTDKLGFRYPRGESYYDVLARLSGAMVDLERVREPILLVSHQAVLRLIIAWMTKRSREEAIKMSVPQHEVIRISYDGLGGPRVMKTFPLGPRRLLDDGQSNL